MNVILEQINSMGNWFVGYAVPMLVQSSVLTAVLLLADLALRRKVRAVFRYWLWMIVLVKLVLPTSLSSPVSLGHLVGNELQSVKISMPEIVASPQATEPVSIETGNREIIMPQKSVIEPAAVQPKIIVTPVTWQGVVFLVWLAVVIAMVLLLLQRAVFVCGLVAQAKEADSLMNDTLKFCCGQMGLKGRVGLRISANATSPAVCGLFRPVILVPESLGTSLGVGHLRAVLLHELAHIKRGDLWLNLVQTILQIIYFYNPLLWLGNAVIRRIREQAVDEMVQVAMGDNAHQYPQTLLDVAKLAFRRPALSLRLIGVVESKSALAGRIKHILNRPIPKSAKLGMLGLAAILIIGCVLLPMAKAEKLEKVDRRSTSKSKAPARSTMPKVVSTTPAAYADDVSAELDKIMVTFDQPMMDQSWSWTGGGETFPKTPGKPSYNESRKICSLPVELEAGKVYWVGINSPSYQNFKSDDGVPAKRYVILFATRGADGKPTPIPQDMLAEAKSINEEPERTDVNVNVEKRRARLRAAFNRRMARDKATYSERELDEIEQLYQIANKKWKSQEAQDSLEKLIAKYGRANRTGCAILYLGQMSDGEQKEQYLKRAIEDFSDCMYGDGVRVGAFARYLLAMHYEEIDKKDEAKNLIAELIKDYPDAVGHNGGLLAEQIPEDMLAEAKVINEQAGKTNVEVEGTAKPMEEAAKLEKVDQNPAGKWQSVDFVQEIEDFEPGEKSWSGELFLKDVKFMKDGRTSSFFTWKRSWIHHQDGRTKARYQIKQMNGTTYLFLPWLSGDVTIRGEKPWYYVMEKVGGKTAKPEIEPIVEQAEPTALAREFVGLLVKEDFSAATKSFDATMRQAMPPEKLADAWKGLLGQSGAFKKEIGTRTEKLLGFDIVYVTCEFEKGPLDIKVVYNSERQVSGLWFVPVPQ